MDNMTNAAHGMTAEEFLRRFPLELNDQQREAVLAVNGPVLLLAVPGSGKTTVLVARLGYLIFGCGIRPENILTITYTVAATHDMKQRFESFFGGEMADRLEFRTINGICARIINYYSRLIGKKAFGLAADEKMTSGVLSRIYQEAEGEWPGEWDLRALRVQITYCKNMMLTGPEIAALDKETGIHFAEIYRRYNAWLREQQLMDYDDQMVYALTILKRSAQVRKAFQDRFRYICVDEAQDTSRIQHAVISILAEGSGNLFMVGDEDQSIYGFRAAYPQALLDFDKEHRDAKILLMEQNFRSREEIIAIADKFIHNNRLRHEKHMVSGRNGTQTIGAAFETAQSAYEAPTVREISLKGRRAQYTYLAKVAADCRELTAVLMRNNESAIPLVDLLERQGIPYRVRNAEISFFTHRTVTDLCCFLKLCLDPRDTESFRQIYYKLGIYLSKRDAEKICRVSESDGISVFEAAEKLAPGPADGGGLSANVMRGIRSTRTHLLNMRNESGDKAIGRIVNYMGYGDHVQGSAESKISILRTIGARVESPGALLDRIGFLRDVIANKPADPACPFIISTIHSSKGLEYDTVYLMDVVDGILPEKVPADVRRAAGAEQEALEEERRLFYVGVTRARKHLNVFATGGKSLFADELFGRRVYSAPKARSRSKAAVRKTAGRVSAAGRSNAAGRSYAANRTSATAQSFDEAGYRKFEDGLGVGLAVKHVRFGEGVVTHVGDDKVKILFEDKERKLSLRILFEKRLLEPVE